MTPVILALVLALLAAALVLVLAGRTELGAGVREMTALVRRGRRGERPAGVLAGARDDLLLAGDVELGLDDLFALGGHDGDRGPAYLDAETLLRPVRRLQRG